MRLHIQHRLCPGLSLIQLLASVAIILVLMAVLFGAMRGVSEQARASGCRNNLRQLASAGILYAGDNGGRLPDRTVWSYPPTSGPSLGPYLDLPPREGGKIVEFDTVLTCPATLASEYSSVSEYHRTYSINQYATGGDSSSGANGQTWNDQVASRGAPMVIHAVTDPSAQAFFMDGTAQPSGDGYNYSVFTAPDRLKSTPTGWRTIYIHNDSINVVFLDGHVETLERTRAELEFVGPTNPGGSTYSPRVKKFWGAQH